VNAVSPRAGRTEILLDVFGSEPALGPMAAVHPTGRIGRPEEITDAVAVAVFPTDLRITGQSLTVDDGGLTARRPSVEQPAAVLLRQHRSRRLAKPRSGNGSTNHFEAQGFRYPLFTCAGHGTCLYYRVCPPKAGWRQKHDRPLPVSASRRP